MPLKNHIENTLRLNPEPTPFFKMLINSLGISTPLVVGYLLNLPMLPSMFAGLMGLVFYLNDHFGKITERLKHLVYVFVLLMLAMYAGALLHASPPSVLAIVFLLSFLVGKIKNHGLELERLIIFLALQFLTASSDPLVKEHLGDLLTFSFFSLINYFFWIILIQFLFKHHNQKINRKRDIWQKVWNEKSLRFPLICAFGTSLSLLIAWWFKFSHANWTVATALIVMLPDSYLGIYKSVQRLLGTVAGVIIATLLLSLGASTPVILLILIFICAFLIPVGLAKNYWIGNIAIAALIIFFLEIAHPHSIEIYHLAYWRILDIAIGSFIGVLSAFLMKPQILKKIIGS